MSKLARYLGNETGASAVEFAMVLPIILLFTFGLIEFGMLFYTSSQLQFATDDAARCASVRQDCRINGTVNSGAIRNYATARYHGLAPAGFTPGFTGACGKSANNAAVNEGFTVDANATFKLNLGVYYRNINLIANSCFP